MRIALLDSNHVALTVARSLNDKGIIVDLLRIKPSLADYSISIHGICDLKEFSSNVEGAFHKLKKHIVKYDYDLLIPITDSAIEICQYYYSDISAITKIAMAPKLSLEVLTNKRNLIDLCSKLEIPFPNSRVVHSPHDLQRLEQVDLKFPLYLKPEKSVKIINNRILRFNVKKVHSLEELKEFCMLNLHSVAVIIQDSVKGTGTGIHLLAKSGEILTMVAQKRHHEPINGGPGSYRESFAVPEDLGYWAKQLIRATKYNGVAMIEFKGSDLNWFIMEVNGRFWGSLPLTVTSGLDLPFWLALLHTKPEQFSKLAIPSVPSFRFQRNLKRDLGWLVLSLLRSSNRLQVALKWGHSLGNLFRGTEKVDFFSVRDPIPFFYDWMTLFIRLWGKVAIHFDKWSAAFAYLTKRKFRKAEVRRILARGDANILIICFGNICRSPFAENLLKQRHSYERVKSAGTYLQENRLSPLDFQSFAVEFHDVDLSRHRSRCLNEELITWADIVLVMDFYNLVHLKPYKISKPIMLFGEFGDGKPIADPYHKPKSTMKLVLAQIAHSSERLARQLRDNAKCSD